MSWTNPSAVLVLATTVAACSPSPDQTSPPAWMADYQREMMPIVYATRDIGPGEPLTPSNTAVRDVPRQFYLDEFVASVPTGAKAKAPILREEALRRERLDLGTGAAPIPLSVPTARPVLMAPSPSTLIVAGKVLEPGHTIGEWDLFLVTFTEVGGEAYLGCHTGRCFTDYAAVLGRVVKQPVLANEPVRAERLQP